jgi:hypothetical protein
MSPKCKPFMKDQFCKHCGTQISSGHKYCSSCGKEQEKKRLFLKKFSSLFATLKKIPLKRFSLYLFGLLAIMAIFYGAYFVYDYYVDDTIPIDFDSDILSEVPDGELFYGDTKVASIVKGSAIMSQCVDGDYDYKPNLGGYEVDASMNVSCELDRALLSKENTDILGLLTHTKSYLDKVEYDNEEYRKQAIELVAKCPSGDLACYTNTIFKHFASTIKYIGDVRDVEHIEGVQKTLETKVGDCEDISITIATFLENLGINTKLVFIKGHAYTLVCDLDLEEVKKYIPEDTPFVYYPYDEYNSCFALDGTTGSDAYMGNDAGYSEEKFIVDPVTKEYFFLDAYEGIIDEKVVPAFLKIDKTIKFSETGGPNKDGYAFITGKTSHNCESIVVQATNSYGGIDDEWELTEYKLGDTSFIYRMHPDPAWGNINFGWNTYQIVASCKGGQTAYDSYTFNIPSY